LKFRSIYIIAAIIFAALLYGVYSYLLKGVPQYLFWKVDLLSTEDFTKITINDPENIWLTGAEGSIYKSEDSGESWSRLRQPDGIALNYMYFINQNTGWVTGENGILLSTTDCGKTWSSITVGDTESSFSAVWFLNENNGFIAGGMKNQKAAGLLYSTTDSGKQWNKCNTPVSHISSLVFLDNAAGICCTSDGLLQTGDGGKSWLPEQSESNLPLERLFFINRESGWAAGSENGVYTTSNGGKTWKVSRGTEEYKINDIFFIDTHSGWAVGKDGLFLYTLNGGKSWERLETGVVDDFLSVYFFNTDFGLICGRNGTVIKVETLP